MTQVLSFNNGLAYKRLTKRVPEKYLESVLRPNVEQGDGIRPSTIYIPHRSLPVKFEDRTTGQYVVIPKGRIVSALTKKNSEGSTHTGGFSNDGTAVKIDQDQSFFGLSRNTAGLIIPANGGVAAVSTYTAADVLAGVPSAEDITSNATADVGVAAGETITMPANAPIGVNFKDVFQDIRGMAHNYDTFKNYGIVTQQHLAIPFIDVSALADYTNLAATLFMPKGFDYDQSGPVTTRAAAPADLSAANPAVVGDTSATHLKITSAAHGLVAGDSITISGAVDGGADSAVDLNITTPVVTVIDANNFVVEIAVADQNDLTGTIVWAVVDAAATGAGYAAGEAYFSFLTLDGANAGHTNPGAFVTADIFGNWIPQYKTLSSNNHTVQTVGRILGLDSRFPKDLLETVEARRFDSSPLARPAGNLTEGLSEHLFWFAYRVLEGAGYSWPTDGTDPAKKVIAMVQAGCFGMAHIQLNIK